MWYDRYSVLDSVNGDQDRAIDALLGMSDPEYKGEVRTAAADATVRDANLVRPFGFGVGEILPS